MTDRPSSEVVTHRPPKPRKPWMCVHHRTDGSLCEAPRVRGTEPPTCQAHGASAPQVKAAARRRLARDDALDYAQREMARLGEAWVDVDPLDGLLRLYQEAEWNCEVLRSAISGLAPQVARDNGIAIPEQVVEFEKGGTHVPAAVHVLVDMYDRERDRAAKYGKACIDAGVDVKRVRLEETRTQAHVDQMVSGLEAYRSAAGVDGEAHQAGLAAMAKVMRT